MSKTITIPSSLGPLFDFPSNLAKSPWETKALRFPPKSEFRAIALPGNGPLVLAIDWAGEPPSLHEWLIWLRARLATKPRVLFGWSADPLVGELGHREAFLRIVRATLRWGMQVCIRTESALGETEVAQLKTVSSQVKFLVPLLGFTPTPSEIAKLPDRLDTIRKLKSQGFNPKIGMEPMIPGIHDRPEVIDRVLRDIAIFAPSSVQVSFLTLPEDRRGVLLSGPADQARRNGYHDAFIDGPSLEILGSRMRLLPLAARQKAFARIHAMSAARGIRVDVCPWTNPDFVKKNSVPENETQPRVSLLKRFLELSHPG